MESMIDYLLQHHDKLLYLLAGLSLVIELTVVGLSGPLLFFAVGCALTGFMVSAGLLNSWEFEVLFVGVFSILSALLLWGPLKRFQGEHTVRDTSSDMIGQVVPVSEQVTTIGGSIRHSGINWSARLDESQTEPLGVDSRVKITAVEGTVIIVKAVN